MKFDLKLLALCVFFPLWTYSATLEEMEMRLQILEKEAAQLRQDIALKKQEQTQNNVAISSSHPLDKNIQTNENGNLMMKAWGKEDVISSLQVSPKPNPRNQQGATAAAEPEIEVIQPQETTPINPTQSAISTENQPTILSQAIADIQAGKFSTAEISLKNYLSSGQEEAKDKAYYWMGEAAFRQDKIPQAASYFTNAYNEDKQGSMAADSLIRLAMSLSQIDRIIEACRVYDVIEKDFAHEEAKMSIVKGEKNRLACTTPNRSQ